MNSSTDYLHLNDQKCMKNIRESLPKGIVKTQNLLTVRDDVLFMWNCQDSCVLTLNVKAARSREGDSVSYQKLLTPSQPCFAPELLTVNESCTLLAVAGPLGLLVMQLPRRGPPHGSFAGNKELIYCQSYSLDERLFAYSKVSEVRQVRWHPASPSDCHLLVLTSDNVFRLYVIRNGSANLVRVHQIGTQPFGILSGTRVPFLAGLGETGVDFDFGLPHTPAKLTGKTDYEDLEWPIYVLRGDGEVFIMVIDIHDRNKAVLKGPLCMYPSSDDNYGADACAIICFKTTPPVLAISTCTGTIYHSILLTPNDDSEFGGKKHVTTYTSYSLHPADKVLYVFESIELELGISVTDTDNAYSCPIFLHQDDSTKGRYFCSHETGVHVVNVPFISELEKCVDTDEDDLEMALPNLNVASSAEYLLCTHATGCSKVTPVLGFSLFHCPTALIALLATGQVVTLPLVSAMLPSNQQLEMLSAENITSPLKKMLSEPFDSHIKKFLKNGMNQPILKLSSDSNPASKDCYELLTRATQIFREDHFKRYDKIREELEKRVKTLQMLKIQQTNELHRLSVEKANMQSMAEKLAEKYEDIKDKQEELTKRCEKLLISVTQKQPTLTDTENNLYKELKKAEEKIKSYVKAMDHVKSKQGYQKLQMANWMKQEKKKRSELGEKQSKNIKSTLHDMTMQMQDMMEKIRIYKQELGLK